MAKKKKEEEKIKPSPKKINQKSIEIEKYSLNELFEKNNIKPLNAVGFLSYYGLTDKFKEEFENNEIIVKFSNGEFNDMYERYMRREI